MLKDLKILNGVLDLEFNQYIYEYTITVDSDVEKLDIAYELEEECSLKIKDNILNKKENIVTLEVYNIDEVAEYKLYVYKNSSNEVNGIEDYRKSLEIVNTEEIDIMKVQILGVSIFLLILIVFCIIFRKQKH